MGAPFCYVLGRLRDGLSCADEIAACALPRGICQMNPLVENEVIRSRILKNRLASMPLSRRPVALNSVYNWIYYTWTKNAGLPLSCVREGRQGQGVCFFIESQLISY
jgi:hypothetical protein